MSLLIATHSGPFHADDVMATALVRVFVDADAAVVRTRDPEKLAPADVVLDVGGVFDPEARRFDHHQATYEGPRSSAGMVLDWLESTGAVSPSLAKYLRDGVMEYLDDVDNGRVAPKGEVPCFPRIVDALNQVADTEEGFDEAFQRAVTVATWTLEGLRAGHAKIELARAVVKAAMDEAAAEGRNVLFLDAYHSWKAPYFELGGETHPTELVLFPGTDDSWRVIAIPPRFGEFGQKRSLPAAWAGLTDGDLEAVTGVPGSVFCHKNLFIAVFRTRDAAVEALQKHGLLYR
ncbi:MAG: MYG1 family protein [Alphaproteobacteria bacterium]|nr:MYG1 family protein [Alphaproteobacteria bacterium]